VVHAVCKVGKHSEVHILDGKNKMGRRLAGRLSFMVHFLSSLFESREFSVFGLAGFWPERRKG
jgi:hypothetical protein